MPAQVAHHRPLAILGGAPAFAQPLHVGRPNLPDRDLLQRRIDEVLDRGWLTNNGPAVQEFECRLEALLGVRHCIAMCNATVALEIVVRALGMTGEVIVPSFTFVATAHALQWQQITPVFCDIDPRTHNLDPAKVERMITPRTTGILGVHTWGRPCDVPALTDIARRHRLRLAFDAAHAFGCSRGDRLIGSFGDAEVFSFHATKFLNTFEGGAVATNDDDLAKKLRLMKNFGFTGFDQVDSIGVNGKMSEISAAMGLAGLACMDSFIARNRANYDLYRARLSELPGVRVIRYDDQPRQNYQYVVLDIDAREAGLSRDELVRVLQAENVLARRYFFPGCHRMEPYRSNFPHAGLLLPETERLVQRVMTLPTGTAVNAEDIEVICEVIRAALGDAGRVRLALQ